MLAQYYLNGTSGWRMLFQIDAFDDQALYRRLESLKGRGQMHSTSKLLDEELFAATELSNPSVQDVSASSMCCLCCKHDY